ncbi:ABC transporter permease subunit [Roseomonas sp. GC11]|uniref:ABC transporter permease n=1 Tax=Roseomonas sp. GC11 TaxID=2950546 RepID=UPI00210E11F2|nr:ABC transporter permease subunit [Roseomonas sp. GC11]MCQ4161593.1 ABC transporter permease subunit [Roseomonas sp. GC11]
MDFPFLTETFLRLLGGLPLTIQLAAGCVAGGGVLALLLVLLRQTSRPGAWIADFYIYVFRGTPLLVQIFLIYYGLGQFGFVRQSVLWPFLREPYVCALLSLALCDAAYAAEILRGGLRAVPNGAIEAARVAGMGRAKMAWRIILPLAIRQALPAYGNEIISMTRATALTSTVTLMEVTGVARAIIAETFRPFEVFLCAAVIYLGLTFVISRIIWGVERWLNPVQAAR